MFRRLHPLTLALSHRERGRERRQWCLETGHTSRDLFNPFDSPHREMDRLFDEFSRGLPFGGLRRQIEGGLTVWPSMDVAESDDGTVTVTAELPGIDEKDLTVDLHDNVLTIRGEKKSERKESKQDYHMSERSYGAFSRRIALPFEADPDKVTAHVGKGVLTVTVPRPPEAQKKARRIEVKPAG
ncbi:MAG: Hsp20/alpha crystallin family protein [Azospirillaceae bacterium]